MSGSENPPTGPKRFHFISGLPRSGSTLLAALLKQNPRFHAHMSGPVSGIFDTLLSNMSRSNEFSVFISDAQRQRILRGVFDSFYADSAKEIVFDTSRAWCGKLPALKTLFPDVKIIVCVRDISWVIDSFERLIRKNAFQPSSIFNFQTNGTVYTRANGLSAPDGMVGRSYDLIKEAFYGEDARHLLLVQYETLVSAPEQALAAIYDFVGEPGFAHDFNHIEFDAQEFDAQTGTPGLHDVAPQLRPSERQTILPPDLFHRFQKQAFWRDPGLNLRNVRVV
jgi:sulfotransferase